MRAREASDIASSGEPMIRSRLGVRARPLAQAKQLGMMGAGAYLVIGASGSLTYNFIPYEHPTLWILLSVTTLLVGIGTLLAAMLIPVRLWPVMYPPAALALVFYGIFLAPPYIAAAGYPEQAQGTAGYGVVLFFAFYVLRRWLALVCAVLTIVGQAVVEYTSDVAGPELRLLWLFSFLIVMAILFNHFSDALETERSAKARALSELADLNQNLEAKVAEQVDEVERLGRLRRFLAAPVAEAVLSSDVEGVLAPHRREIAVLFCDLRGFTAFTKRVEPEEVIEVLEAYYSAAGREISRFQATLGSFEGDGLMAYLNDPVPCEEPATRIVEMAIAIAEGLDELTPSWQARGFNLSYGIGMAFGHATLGAVGFDGRSDYTALGTVVNLGARLCSTAEARQLIVDHRIFLAAGAAYEMTALDPRELKGFDEPVPVYIVGRPSVMNG